MKPFRLSLIFFRYAQGAAAAWKASMELEQALQAAWERARAPWPGIVLREEEYFHHLADRWPGEKVDCSPTDLLEQIQLEGLYLVCACVHRLPGAIEALEKDYFARLTGPLLRQ